MLTEKTRKNSKKYSCENCDFHTVSKNDYVRHCSTRKHILLTGSVKTLTEKTLNHICSKCGKELCTENIK
jgi:predicted RNA-binding Zn-ribbon protein involved in translation (DUF1610 family)